MPTMKFIEPDGQVKEVDAPLGLSVMEIAHRHNIDLEGLVKALWFAQLAM